MAIERHDCTQWPTIGALTDHLTRLHQDEADGASLQELLRCMPEWATFHEVRSALGVAGFDLLLVRRDTAQGPSSGRGH